MTDGQQDADNAAAREHPPQQVVLPPVTEPARPETVGTPPASPDAPDAGVIDFGAGEDGTVVVKRDRP